MTLFFIVFSSLLLLQGLASIRGGMRFLRFIRSPHQAPPPDFHPHVTVLLPCKGRDPFLKENLESIARQRYRSFEIIFIVEDARDGAAEVIRKIMPRNFCRSRLIVAGRATVCGQKIHNLLAGLSQVSPATEILVFADADALMNDDWLEQLIAPLGSGDESVGAATGFRWYLGDNGRFLPALLSAWNGTAVTELGNHGRNFCWGGSTAITRRLFEELGVAQAWQRALSDDYVLSKAVRDSGRTICFVPNCLVVSRNSYSLRDLVRFTTRQMTITRVYSPRLWAIGLAGNCGFVIALAGSAIVGMNAAMTGGGYWLPALCFFLYLLAGIKGGLRTKAAIELLPGYRREILANAWMYVFGVPLVSLLYVLNTVRAGFSATITWRGITYRMVSSSKTEILARE